jgi:N-acetylglucosamine-6-sulfatase
MRPGRVRTWLSTPRASSPLGRAQRRRSLSGVALVTLLASSLITVRPASADALLVTGFSPTRGAVNSTVSIYGVGLTLASSVKFNGVPATFEVVSDSEISATVPSGATTGPITVDSMTTSDDFVVQPNLLLILTDDQRYDELTRMPTVSSELVDKGVQFNDGYVVDSLCCPSRTTILTGKYSHGTDIYRNKAPYGGFDTFTNQGEDQSTLATWLSDAGYRTGLVGKYLNGYVTSDAGYIPPGWDEWDALLLGSDEGWHGYYDYSMSVNGQVAVHGEDPSDYSTYVLRDEARNFIAGTPPDQPLFLYFAPRAPHAPATPAPGDVGACSGIPPNRPPNYNEADVSDKPAYIRSIPPWTAPTIRHWDGFYRKQCESLLAVDRSVGDLLQSLRDAGRLQDTLIVFMSDNGLADGEHRWAKKIVPYEESIHVPFVARYDALETHPGSTNSEFVLNLDIAPTFAAAAGTTAAGAEGKSFLPMLRGPIEPWRRDFLIEHSMVGPPAFCAVRNERYLYVEYETGERELYDLSIDPFELVNRASSKTAPYPAARDRLHSRLLQLCNPPPPGLTP